jgi:uncharacterized protein
MRFRGVPVSFMRSALSPLLMTRTSNGAVRAPPAALASTFVTSIVGSAAYLLLAIGHSGSIAPEWSAGVSCGVGGLIGGYLGARLQPQVPETALRLLLGILAIGISLLYLAEAMR